MAVRAMDNGVAWDDGPREAILEAAARCFMARGFKATSLDDIALKLGATKGMVYHYFGSKAELFFHIHQHGMDALFQAVEPESVADRPATERLARMAHRHVATLIDTQHYQRAVAEGVQMHLRVSTTQAERRRLTQLQERRRVYERLFLGVVQEGIAEGSLSAREPALAVKPFFGALNSVINWYHPRHARDVAIEQVVSVALNGLRA